MPFDPKLVHQAEAPLTDSGDLALPDDLLELAAQLSDDAQHLAKIYPAPSSHLAPTHSSHLAPRDESVITNGSSTRQDAFPLAEREGHYASASQSIGLLSAVADDATVGRSSAPSFIAFSAGEGRSTAPSYDPNVTPSHLRRTSRRLLRAVALVASLAAVIVGVTLWYPRESANQPRPFAATPERSSAATTHLTSTTDAANFVSPLSISPAPPPPSSPAPAPPPPASRDTFLHEYSGPELEGIYDLIGDSEDDKISI